MSQAMAAHDEFTCGQCGATSQWGERYYQARTPGTPFLPLYSFWDWEKVEHFRAFCPKCGALVADRQAQGFGWANGAQPKVPHKVPTEGNEGGHWISGIDEIKACLVPHGENKLDIEGFERVHAAHVAKEQTKQAMSVQELIARLRKSKGTRAGDIEWELASRGKAAVPYLIEALADPEVYLRWRTCYVLKQMKDKPFAARPALEKALRDSEESVRRGAADALAFIGKPEPPKLPTPARPWWKFW